MRRRANGGWCGQREQVIPGKTRKRLNGSVRFLSIVLVDGESMMPRKTRRMSQPGMDKYSTCCHQACAVQKNYVLWYQYTSLRVFSLMFHVPCPVLQAGRACSDILAYVEKVLPPQVLCTVQSTEYGYFLAVMVSSLAYNGQSRRRGMARIGIGIGAILSRDSVS